MEKEKIDRINQLARKRKAQGLTDEELQEHEDLRKEYLAGFRANMKAVLDSVRVQEADGSLRPLRQKSEVDRH